MNSASDLILILDEERRRQGISQMKISEMANMPDVGQRYERMYNTRNCKLSVFLDFLHVLGLEVKIFKAKGPGE